MLKTLEKIKERLEEELKLADGVKEKCARENPLMFDNAKGYSTGISNALHIVNQVAKEVAADINVGCKNGWIPCSEKLPEDGDHRFYMCIVENHEEDLPMFCQFVEELGFGYWQDIFDKDSLGFVDSEFSTNEELGYEKVIAWQPLPGPYEEKEND